jgi:hypothetical protein
MVDEAREHENATAPAASTINRLNFVLNIYELVGQTRATLHHLWLFRFRFVEMFAGRQIGEFLEMLWFQGLRNDVFPAEPFPEIDQTATLRTEGGVLSCQPVA